MEVNRAIKWNSMSDKRVIRILNFNASLPHLITFSIVSKFIVMDL